MHQALQQAEAGVPLAADAQPQAGGMPVAAGAAMGPDHQCRRFPFLRLGGAGRIQPLPEAVATLLVPGGAVAAGLPDHQGAPVAAAPTPAPGQAEGVECQPTRAAPAPVSTA